MRFDRGLLVCAALCSAAIISPAIASPEMESIRLSLVDRHTRPKRGKGQQAKPQRKPNRVTVSRRVRRKHRRAA